MSPKVNIILAHNYQGSITRIAWIYAQSLAARGYQVSVLFPYVTDQFDHSLFSLRKKPLAKAKFLLRTFAKAVLKRHSLRKSNWIGFEVFGKIPGVSVISYPILPNRMVVPDGDFILCLQSQLLPWLERLGAKKGEIIDSLHTSDYELDPVLQPWMDHIFVNICKHSNVKRFAVSQGVKKRSEARGIRVDRVIYNGVEPHNFPIVPFEKRQNGILMFSDPRIFKGYEFGIKVLKKIRETLPDLYLASIGNVSGLDTSVFDHVHGFVNGNDIGAVYGRYRYFLFPSLFEGFPAPPLEAMATGAVGILANTAGVEEYGQSRFNAMVFEPNNLDDAVSQALAVINDVTLARKIALEAPQTVKKFSCEQSTNALIEFMTSPPALKPHPLGQLELQN